MARNSESDFDRNNAWMSHVRKLSERSADLGIQRGDAFKLIGNCKNEGKGRLMEGREEVLSLAQLGDEASHYALDYLQVSYVS